MYWQLETISLLNHQLIKRWSDVIKAEQNNFEQEHNHDAVDVERALVALSDNSRYEISVIIPLVGNIHRQRVFPVIDRLCRQKGVSIEIIIVHPTNEPPVPFADNRVQFIGVHPKFASPINISYLRNEGVHHSNGSLVFIYDADILLGRDTYILELLEAFDGCQKVAICDPPRYSVLNIDQEKLVNELQQGVSVEDVVIPVEEFVMCYKYAHTSPPKLLFRRQGHRTYFAYAHELESSEANIDKHAFWQGNGWNGGLIVPRKYYDLVAGYCEKFVGWGHEDSDMRQKLARIMPVFRLIHDPIYTKYHVYHLEHERPSTIFSSAEQNNLIRQRRRTLPLLTLIHEDTDGESIYQSSLRKRHPWIR